MVFTIQTINESVKELWESSAVWTKTPAQLYLYAGEYMHGLMIADGRLRHIHWKVFDYFIGEDKIITTLLENPVDKIWYIPIPNITFVSRSKSFTVPDGGSIGDLDGTYPCGHVYIRGSAMSGPYTPYDGSKVALSYSSGETGPPSGDTSVDYISMEEV